MDSLKDIKREIDNVEYEIQLPARESVDEPFVVVRGKRWTVQKLVNKFGSNLPIRELGQEEWQPASYYYFRPEKIRKNVAVAQARLRNTFKRPAEPDMFSQFYDE